MSVTDFKETRLTLAAVAGLLDVHTATVWRWTLHGVKGRKLRSFLVGGRRFVSREDLEAFLSIRAPPGKAEIPAAPSSAHSAGEELDRRFRS